MACLLDTGILLRLVDTQDRLHDVVRQAVESLAVHQEELFTSTQNIAEFWNVATRPVADNGLGLPVATVANLLEQVIEPTCALLVEPVALYGELKRLGVKYEFRGKQVHDARLVALMLCWKVEKVLTLNERDFRRYEPEGITLITPESMKPAE
jgi:predicted nucleic acid-binding protein